VLTAAAWMATVDVCLPHTEEEAKPMSAILTNIANGAKAIIGRLRACFAWLKSGWRQLLVGGVMALVLLNFLGPVVPQVRFPCNLYGTFKNLSAWRELECLESEATRYGTIAAGAARVEDYDSTARSEARTRFQEDLSKVRSLPGDVAANDVRFSESDVKIAAALAALTAQGSQAGASNRPPLEATEDVIKKLKELLPDSTSPKLNSTDDALARLARLRYLQAESENLELPPPERGYRRQELSVSLTAWTKGDARAALVYLDLYPYNADRWCHWAARAVTQVYLNMRVNRGTPSAVAHDAFLHQWRMSDSQAGERWTRSAVLREAAELFPGVPWSDEEFWKWVQDYDQGPNRDPFANCHTTLESRQLLPNLVYVEPVANPRFALSAALTGATVQADINAGVGNVASGLTGSRGRMEAGTSAELEVNALSFAAGQRRAGWIFLQSGKGDMMRPFESRVHMVVDVPSSLSRLELLIHKSFLNNRYEPLVTFSEQTRRLNLARELLNEIEGELDPPHKLALRLDESPSEWTGDIYSSLTNWELLKTWTRNLGGLGWSERLVVDLPAQSRPQRYSIFAHVVGLGPDQHQLAYVAIEGDRIRGIYRTKQEVPPEFSVLEYEFANDYLYPGLIDLHNHPHYNFIPRWKPVTSGSACSPRFCDRREWRALAQYQQSVEEPFAKAKHEGFEMEALLYGDIRAMLGGATTLQGADNVGGSLSAMRRLWDNSISDTGYIKELDKKKLLSAYKAQLDSGVVHRLFLHVGEGTGPEAQSELSILEADQLLGNRLVLIHGVAFTANDLEKIKDSGAAVVWSPRSNLTLYGATLDIATVLAKNIPVALAPDWTVTGSSNLFQELKCASEYAKANDIRSLTPQRLFNMVSQDAARIAGLIDADGEPMAGIVRESGYADFFILRHHQDDPFTNLLQGHESDIRAVVIGGLPVIGEDSFLKYVYGAPPHEHLRFGNLGLADDLGVTGSHGVDPFATGSRHLLSVVDRLAPLVEAPTATCSVRRH